MTETAHNCYKEFLNDHPEPGLKKLSLDGKILHSKMVIREFNEFMGGKIAVSFSGGKDSTVLLHLVRSMFPDCPAVFYDTGMEFPEIVDFVKSTPNVTMIKPMQKVNGEMKRVTFKSVIERWGYPVIGKEVAQYADRGRRGNAEAIRRFTEEEGRYGYKRYAFLLDAPFKISPYCCDKLKKQPAHRYQKETGNGQFIGSRIDESQRREARYLINGETNKNAKLCTPLSIWTKHDVDSYILKHNIDICEVYTKMGYERTGCMYCAFGIMGDDSPNRFQKMKHTHPKQWEYCMRPWSEGGLGLQEVLDFIGVKSGKDQTNLEEFE